MTSHSKLSRVENKLIQKLKSRKDRSRGKSRLLSANFSPKDDSRNIVFSQQDRLFEELKNSYKKITKTDKSLTKKKRKSKKKKLFCQSVEKRPSLNKLKQKNFPVVPVISHILTKHQPLFVDYSHNTTPNKLKYNKNSPPSTVQNMKKMELKLDFQLKASIMSSQNARSPRYHMRKKLQIQKEPVKVSSKFERFETFDDPAKKESSGVEIEEKTP